MRYENQPRAGSYLKLLSKALNPFKISAMDRPPNENLLSRLEQSLRQSRAARMHLAARLRELEVEADAGRAELAEMDTLASQS